MTLLQGEETGQCSDDIVISDLIIPGLTGEPSVKLRLYTPQTKTKGLGCYLNIHGGGFVMGGLELDHQRCLTIARECRSVCVNIEYRLAPEAPYPAQLNDCHAAFNWLCSDAHDLPIDRNKICIGGISAGGAIAVSLCLAIRDMGKAAALCGLVLCYPALDDTCHTTSMLEGEDLYIWNRQNCMDMWRCYLGTSQPESLEYAVPAKVSDLSELPPTYLSVCEHDALRDEGLQFGCRMLSQGVQVEMHCFAGTVHGFDFMTTRGISATAVAEIVAFINQQYA
nr:alpha/beta hydrolase [Shewanella corallii]